MPDIHRSLKFIFRAPRRSKSAVFHPDIFSNSFLQTPKIVMILLVSFFLPLESALPCSCYLRCSLCSRLNYFCKNTRVVFHYRHTGFTSRLHRDLCKMSWAASRGALMWISYVKWNQKAVTQDRGTAEPNVTGQKWKVKMCNLIHRLINASFNFFSPLFKCEAVKGL